MIHFRAVSFHSKTIFVILLAIVASFCAQKQDVFEFKSTGSNMKYIIDSKKMIYALLEVDQSSIEWKTITTSSTIDTFCFKGPFALIIRKDKLNRMRARPGRYVVTSRDENMSCDVFLKASRNNAIGIDEFNCKFHNGAPWPSFSVTSRPMDIFVG